MNHSHSHSHPHHHQKGLIQAICITLFFMVIELGGGWISNSLALISDGAHMLMDVGALLLSLFASWISHRPKTPHMSFGYHRAEVIGALISGLLIWIIAGWLIYEAALRMQSPPDVKGPFVFVIATIGLIANLVSMNILHPLQGENLNVRAAYLHLVSDCLGSVGAMVAGAVLWFTGWNPIDPIITILFSLLMLFSSWSLIKEAFVILMESSPSTLNPVLIQTSLESFQEVKEVHDLHIWTVSSGKHALSVHIVSQAGETILQKVNTLLSQKFNIHHTTIQIEHPDHFQSERCYDCNHSIH